ncbi:hypothetical protein HK098_003102 [Nowakowskiella sp. JEL0407]|nr:hypothetical protein HK098_003102 [Nowakowskiella sp. JEL0407]
MEPQSKDTAFTALEQEFRAELPTIKLIQSANTHERSSSYFAVSHVWPRDESEFLSQVIINNEVLPTYFEPSKVDDIAQWSAEYGYPFWTDMLSINQHDRAETVRHLRCMWYIYEQTEFVAIVLSEDDKQLFRESNLTSDSECYDAALFLGKTNWMKRVWTLQEVVAAREVKLRVDDQDVSKQINEILRVDKDTIDDFKDRVKKTNDNKEIRSIDKIRRIVRICNESGRDFADISDEIATRDCHEIYDRVHAACLIQSQRSEFIEEESPELQLVKYLKSHVPLIAERWIDYCGLGIGESDFTWVDAGSMLQNVARGDWTKRSQRRVCKSPLYGWKISAEAHLLTDSIEVISLKLNSCSKAEIRGCRWYEEELNYCNSRGVAEDGKLTTGWDQNDLCLLLNHVTARDGGEFCSNHIQNTHLGDPSITSVVGLIDKNTGLLLVLDNGIDVNHDTVEAVQLLGNRFLVCAPSESGNVWVKIGTAIQRKERDPESNKRFLQTNLHKVNKYLLFNVLQ